MNYNGASVYQNGQVLHETGFNYDLDKPLIYNQTCVILIVIDPTI